MFSTGFSDWKFWARPLKVWSMLRAFIPHHLGELLPLLVLGRGDVQLRA